MALPRATGQAMTDAVTYLPKKVTQYTVGQLPDAAQKMIRAVTSPASMISDRTGKSVYEGAMAPFIDAAEAKGKKDAGETLYRQGIRGSTQQIRKQITSQTDMLKKLRDSVLSKADKAGAVVSREEAWDPMFQKLQKMVTDRRLTEKEADNFLTDLSERYYRGADPNTLLATQWKTDLDRMLPGNGWEELAKKTAGTEIIKDTRGGLKKATEAAVDRATGQGEHLGDVNNVLGTFLDMRKPLRREALKARGVKVLSPWDLALLSGEVYHPGFGTGALAMKKAGDILGTRAARSGIGYHLMDFGRSQLAAPLADAAIRRRIIDKTDKGE
jgi:hypothetical protein